KLFLLFIFSTKKALISDIQLVLFSSIKTNKKFFKISEKELKHSSTRRFFSSFEITGLERKFLKSSFSFIISTALLNSDNISLKLLYSIASNKASAYLLAGLTFLRVNSFI